MNIDSQVHITKKSVISMKIAKLYVKFIICLIRSQSTNKKIKRMRSSNLANSLTMIMAYDCIIRAKHRNNVALAWRGVVRMRRIEHIQHVAYCVPK